MTERPILVDEGPLADGVRQQLEVVRERLKHRQDAMCTYEFAALWSDEERNQIIALLKSVERRRVQTQFSVEEREIVAELLRSAEQKIAQLDQAASESNRRWDEMHARRQHQRAGRSRGWRSRS
jgi:hypothetical protein